MTKKILVPLDLSNNKITNLTDPSAAQDAATKAYVDAVVLKKYVASVGGATSIVVAHNLNSLDVQVQVYLIATGEAVECDVVRTSTSQVTLGFAVAPAANAIRVVVQG